MCIDVGHLVEIGIALRKAFKPEASNHHGGKRARFYVDFTPRVTHPWGVSAAQVYSLIVQPKASLVPCSAILTRAPTVSLVIWTT